MARNRVKEREMLRAVLDLLRDPPADLQAESEVLERTGCRDQRTRMKLKVLAYLQAGRELPPDPTPDDLEDFHTCMHWHRTFMLRCANAGLTDHPTVGKWVDVHRLLGDTDAMRALRSHRAGESKPHPKAVRPLTDHDLDIITTIEQCIASGTTSKSAVLSELKRKGLVVDSMTRQAFHNLLTRLDLHHLFPKA